MGRSAARPPQPMDAGAVGSPRSGRWLYFDSEDTASMAPLYAERRLGLPQHRRSLCSFCLSCPQPPFTLGALFAVLDPLASLLSTLRACQRWVVARSSLCRPPHGGSSLDSSREWPWRLTAMPNV